MTTSERDRLAELQEAQRAAWAEEEAAQAEQRRRFPDAQPDGPQLQMPTAQHDPSPREQQHFADQYRAAHADADMRRARYPGDTNATTDLADAVYAWRVEEARARWQEAASWYTTSPPCLVCGHPSEGRTVTVAGRALQVCARCQPSIHTAVAARTAKEIVAGGRTRAEAAAELVAKAVTLCDPSEASTPT